MLTSWISLSVVRYGVHVTNLIVSLGDKAKVQTVAHRIRRHLIIIKHFLDGIGKQANGKITNRVEFSRQKRANIANRLLTILALCRRILIEPTGNNTTRSTCGTAVFVAGKDYSGNEKWKK